MQTLGVNIIIEMYIATFGLKKTFHILGEHNGMKPEVYGTNLKFRGSSIYPYSTHVSLIRIIESFVMYVAKHQ